jgi:plastocyanin
MFSYRFSSPCTVSAFRLATVAPAFILTATLVSSCSSDSSPAKDPAGTAATSQSAAPVDTGLQTVTGKAPAAGGFPSIVVLEPIGAPPAEPQAPQPSMDQEQQTFIPSLLLVRTGQPVDFLNHDDVLHNVRVKDDETKESAFNVAIPTGEKYTHTFKRDGFYDVGCDIHPGMSAQIMSTSSPYAVVADASGAFTIANVPNGPYKAVAYAGAQTIDKEVNVGPGSTTVDLTAR